MGDFRGAKAQNAEADSDIEGITEPSTGPTEGIQSSSATPQFESLQAWRGTHQKRSRSRLTPQAACNKEACVETVGFRKSGSGLGLRES